MLLALLVVGGLVLGSLGPGFDFGSPIDRGRIVEWDLTGSPTVVIGVSLDIHAQKSAQIAGIDSVKAQLTNVNRPAVNAALPPASLKSEASAKLPPALANDGDVPFTLLASNAAP